MNSDCRFPRGPATARFISIVLILAGVFTFFSVANLYWVSARSFFPLHPDESFHLTQQLQLSRKIPPGSFAKASQFIELIRDYPYPPFFHCLAAVVGRCFGSGPITAVSTNTLFLLLLILSVYRMCRRRMDRTGSVFAVIVLGSYPMIFSMQRWFMIDFALTAIVVLTIDLLDAPDCCENRKKALLLGLVMGAGMLTKWSYFGYVVLPLSLRIGKIFREKGRSGLIPLGIAALCTTVLACLYIDPIFLIQSTLALEFNPGYIPLQHEETSKLVELIGYYPISLVYQCSPFLFAVFVFGVFLTKKEDLDPLALPIATIVGALIVFSLIPNKAATYLMPVLPMIALISFHGLSKIDHRRFRRIISLFIVVLAIGQFLAISFLPEYRYSHSSIVYPVTPKTGEITLRRQIRDIFDRDIFSSISSPKVDFSSVQASWPLLITLRVQKPKRIDLSAFAKISKLCVIDAIPERFLARSIRYAALLKKLAIVVIDYPQTYPLFVEQASHCEYLIVINDHCEIWPEKKQLLKQAERNKLAVFIADFDIEKVMTTLERLGRTFALEETIAIDGKGRWGRVEESCIASDQAGGDLVILALFKAKF